MSAVYLSAILVENGIIFLCDYCVELGDASLNIFVVIFLFFVRVLLNISPCQHFTTPTDVLDLFKYSS